MKQIKCEMCGSTSFVKQDGMFTCQHCGVQYSVDEAKKMMVEIEGTVNVEGTVKIDSSNELKNLYELARRAKNNNDSDRAQRYYEQIAVKDPSSWEANFYSIYFRSLNCKIAGIQKAANDVTNCLFNVFQLILNNVEDENEQTKAILEVSNHTIHISNVLFNGYLKHYNGIDLSIRGNYGNEVFATCVATVGLIRKLANLSLQVSNKYEKLVCVPAYKAMIEQYTDVVRWVGVNKETGKLIDKTIKDVVVFIKKYEPSFEAEAYNTMMKKTANLGKIVIAVCLGIAFSLIYLIIMVNT